MCMCAGWGACRCSERGGQASLLRPRRTAPQGSSTQASEQAHTAAAAHQQHVAPRRVSTHLGCQRHVTARLGGSAVGRGFHKLELQARRRRVHGPHQVCQEDHAAFQRAHHQRPAVGIVGGNLPAACGGGARVGVTQAVGRVGGGGGGGTAGGVAGRACMSSALPGASRGVAGPGRPQAPRVGTTPALTSPADLLNARRDLLTRQEHRLDIGVH